MLILVIKNLIYIFGGVIFNQGVKLYTNLLQKCSYNLKQQYF